MTLLVGSIFHMTRKIVSEMTYNVSMGTLNPTIPYLSSWVAVVVFVLVTTSKILWISFLDLLVRQSFADALQQMQNSAATCG